MYCLQQPILAEVQVCCWKGKHALAKVTAIVQSCNASFAKVGRGEKGRIFNIIAFSTIYVKYNSMYIVTMLLHMLRVFYVSSSTINVSNRMYMFNPFYSTVTPLRMCTLVLHVVDIVHMSNLKFCIWAHIFGNRDGWTHNPGANYQGLCPTSHILR